MRILDVNNQEIEHPNLNLGYLVPESILKKHHMYIPYSPEESHYETIMEYPNGGKDIEKIIDKAEILEQPEWDEYEDIQRYILYTQEELQIKEEEKQQQKKEEEKKQQQISFINQLPSQIDEIESQITYTAMETDTLAIMNQPMTLSMSTENVIASKSPRDILAEKITKWFNLHLWTEQMVNDAVTKGILTNEELLILIPKE